MEDTSYSTLSDIIIKVRRLTRSPSEAQITDDQITDYINNFLLYDLPEHLSALKLKKNLTFYTQPYVDTYSTNTTNTNDPLYNFKNIYITAQSPVYVSGNEIFYSQDESQFYRLYPKITTQTQIGTGDGTTTSYSATANNFPFLRNTIIFSSLDANSNSMTIIDSPEYDSITGYPEAEGLLLMQNDPSSSRGTINYLTGAYAVSFPIPPGAGQAIWMQTVPYPVNTPQAILFFNDQFVLRPAPDKSYAIQVDVMQRPSAMLQSGSMPELSDWWQYIAYGAAKKVFEDRMDLESVQLIMPEYDKQERLVTRRTINQLKNSRSSTIYTDQSEALVSGWGRGGWF